MTTRRKDVTTSFGAAVIANPVVDEQRMSATAVITTAVIDRDGEIILPGGVATENYERNPVVLWNHGYTSNDKPIAKCKHPDGSLALEITEQQIVGTSYFAKGHRDAEQIFDLISQEIVRATSISVQPFAVSSQTVDGHQVRVIEQSEIVEWSWVTVGANPEAVAKVLDHGRLAGSTISGPLRKSLLPHLPRRRVLGKGMDFESRVKRIEQTIDSLDEHFRMSLIERRLNRLNNHLDHLAARR